MSKQKILTAQEFLEQKKIYDENRSLVYHSERFGGDIAINDNADITEMREIISQTDLGEYEQCVRLIYMCCPLFKSQEFREVYEVKEPYDVVRASFKGAVLELYSLGKKIMEVYGFLDGSVVEKVKK